MRRHADGAGREGSFTASPYRMAPAGNRVHQHLSQLFFRGALFATVRDEHPVVTSTALYTAATLATRNPALIAAAAVMGTLFGVQRRASGGVQAPALTHLTWSVLMLRYLPPLFEQAIAEEQQNDRHERPGD